jgi:hypothetical protein
LPGLLWWFLRSLKRQARKSNKGKDGKQIQALDTHQVHNQRLESKLLRLQQITGVDDRLEAERSFREHILAPLDVVTSGSSFQNGHTISKYEWVISKYARK